MNTSSPAVYTQREPPTQIGPETVTGQSRLAYQLAAIMLLVDSVIRVLGLLAANILMPVSAISILMAFVLAIGLFEFRSRVRALTILLFALAVIVSSVIVLLYLVDQPVTVGRIGAVVPSLATDWATAIALILLLTGQSKRWRLGLAVGIYLVSLVGPLWSLLAAISNWEWISANILFVAAIALGGAAIVLRYLGRDSTFSRWTVIILALLALSAWIGWCIVRGVPLLAAAVSSLLAASLAAYVGIRDDDRRKSLVTVLLAMLAIPAVIGLCQSFFWAMGT